MTVKAYPVGKAPRFAELKDMPVHLGEINGHHYYAFAKGVKTPAGGKSVKDEEMKLITDQSPIIREIKTQASIRILTVAPVWKQQNALADLYLLGDRTDLTDAEQETLTKAQDLLAQMQVLRERSNAIEASFLSGVAVDYLTDKAWEDVPHAE